MRCLRISKDSKPTWKNIGLTYDVWFQESTLHESGAIDDIVKTLSEKGLTYEKDGAIWYKATEPMAGRRTRS